MLIPRFHDVYDLLFAEIGQYPMKFLSAAVAFELIDPEHLRELHRFAIPYVAEKADDGGDGQSKLAGYRGIGTAVGSCAGISEGSCSALRSVYHMSRRTGVCAKQGRQAFRRRKAP